MNNSNCDFSKDEIVDALKNCQILEGDQIFLQSNIGLFGKLCNASSAEQYCKTFLDVIVSVIGEKGTLVVPAFSYSFCNNEKFIPETTKGVGGLFSEYVRNHPKAIRSLDANFSVSALGKYAKYFTENPPTHSFGKNSFWQKLLEKNGKICRFNLPPNFNTFIHYIERFFSVPYRYNKDFFGIIKINERQIQTKFTHFVRDLDNSKTLPDLSELEKILMMSNLRFASTLGRGKIYCLNTKDIFDEVYIRIKNNPYFLTKYHD